MTLILSILVGLLLVAVAATLLAGQPATPAGAADGAAASAATVALRANYPPDAQFLTIPGARFVPYSSIVDHASVYGGGVSIVSGDANSMLAPVLLPDGARIYGLNFCYYDAVADARLSAELGRNNDPGVGSSSRIAYAESPLGVQGYGCASQESATPLAVIDNRRYNYAIMGTWGTGSTDLILMQAEVVYTLPN